MKVGEETYYVVAFRFFLSEMPRNDVPTQLNTPFSER